MSRGDAPKLAYTVDEACDAMGLARTRVYAAISDGSMKSFKVGRRRMVSTRALEEYVATLERASASEKAA